MRSISVPTDMLSIYKKPWEYIGKPVKLYCTIGVIDYQPPGSIDLYLLGGVDVTGTFIISYSGDLGTLENDMHNDVNPSNCHVYVYGYPVGFSYSDTYNVAHLVIVSNTFDIIK